MPNTIPERQNTHDQLMLLAAQRQAYSACKTMRLVWCIVTVTSAIGGPLLGALLPEFRAWFALVSVIILLVGTIFLKPSMSTKKKRGARLQELFDVNVLQLRWNKIKVGELPDPEEVVSLATKFSLKDPDLSGLRDWYPTDVASLPIGLARLLCQRVNLRWDSQLRAEYALLLRITLLVIFFAVFAFGILMQYSVGDLVLLIVPVLPATLYLVSECKRHAESAKSQEKIKSYLEDLWGRAIAGVCTDQELDVESRLIQDEIYDRRRRCPSIPDAFYRLHKGQFQDQTEKAAKKMVEQALNSGHRSQ